MNIKFNNYKLHSASKGQSQRAKVLYV